MEKIKNYLKNKSVAYFIVLADALLALVLAIIFFATYKGAMPNSAAGNAPESIGIFLLVGFVVEVVALALPQYRFIHVIALAMFGLAVYKEIFIIPALIADLINNVRYQGGDFGTNLFYLISLFVIIVAGIVAVFMGSYKSEADLENDMKIDFKDTKKVATVGGGAVLVIAAVLSGTLVSNSLLKAAAPIIEEPKYNPITDEIKAAAEAFEYDFDPESVLIKEQETWDYANPTLTALSTTSATREGHFLVYYFEGAYAEGYQGDYSESYASLYLWDDGLFAGQSKNDNLRGYWYNSSIADGQDDEGNDIKDCLNMVTNITRYESIITGETTGFYERSAYIFIAPWGGGTRSIIINGYKYYPNVALFIDSGSNPLTYKVGDRFDRNGWIAKRVLKNLSYSAILKSNEVQWSDPTGITNGGIISAAGEYEITASWGGFTATKTVIVTE